MSKMEENIKKTEKIIEGLLFWKNEPMTFIELAKLTEAPPEDIQAALISLKESLSNRGIVLLESEDEVMLGTSPLVSEIIEKISKDELSKELSKSALETLSIVLYKGPIRRSEIDYIRGVNSQFILRHLETRGLVEKFQSDTDSRVYLYKSTFDLLSHLGISRVEDLPEYEALKIAIDNFEQESTEEKTLEAEPSDSQI